MATNPKDAPRHYYSLDEYFALEHAGHVRYEYWDGDIVCMSGGTKEHAQICGNVHYRLRQKLEGGPCRAFTSELPVKTPTLLPYRYPDVVVGCSDLIFESMRRIDELTNPVLLVEVLSPSTELRDREQKFKAYQAIPSFREYLLIAQDVVHVTHYVRQEDGRWTSEDVTDLNAVLVLASVGCTLSMQEIYEEVTFSSV
jgi:Uma2 family endonuclease